MASLFITNHGIHMEFQKQPLKQVKDIIDTVGTYGRNRVRTVLKTTSIQLKLRQLPQKWYEHIVRRSRRTEEKMDKLGSGFVEGATAM